MRLARVFLLSLVVAACTDLPQTSVPRATTPATVTTRAVTTTTVRQCEREEPTQVVFTSTDPVELSIDLTKATLACADHVVVASGSVEDIEEAGNYASRNGAPLLVTTAPSDAADELARLAPTVVTITGDVLPDGVPPGTETRSLLLPAAEGKAPAAGRGSSIWLADMTRPDLAAPVLAIAGSRDEAVLLADPHNMLGDRNLFEAVRATGAERVFVAGSFDPRLVEWQAAALLGAPELPGGGLKLFPGRRLVALYGNPTTSALGVLGEQGPEEAVARAAEIAAGYDADGTPTLLAFEIIATVASAGATEDGNYSEEMSLETLRPWIEVAAANGIYVILDLQPGRTDFLTQAMIYEEFLRLPHVGLALDPEWRLEPDQVHLRQIGSVDSAEINRVSEWLAGLVREQNLPQKFFLIHQFRLDMIEDREGIVTRPELATVIQMDGQGPLSTKYDTWNALTAGTEDLGVSWGWKNFYDEDTPRGGATPTELLNLYPVPVYVSYQ